MPRRIEGRDPSTEQRVAEAIRELRGRRDWSYEETARRMEAAGYKIHASGIFKTETEGRRITVDELVGYAKVFGTSPESLLQYGGAREPRTEQTWRDFLAAEYLNGLLRNIRLRYWDLVRGIRNEVETNDELRRHLLDRVKLDASWQLHKLRESADQARWDISTPEKEHEKLWDEMSTPRMLTGRDVLGEEVDS